MKSIVKPLRNWSCGNTNNLMNLTIDSEFLQLQVTGLMRLGLYHSHDEFVSDALRNLLLNNRALRLELGLQLVKDDEVSLGRAAEIAGMNRWQFMDEMKTRRIKQIIERESAEQMDEGIARFFASKH